MRTWPIVASRFSWVSIAILSAFFATWMAMILLTVYPSSETLWAFNLFATRMFGDGLYVVQGSFGLDTVWIAAITGAVTVFTCLFAPRLAAVRFLSGHIALALVAVPLIRSIVASAGPASDLLVASAGWSWSGFADIDAARIPLIVLAALACFAAHAELLGNIRREAVARKAAAVPLPIPDRGN